MSLVSTKERRASLLETRSQSNTVFSPLPKSVLIFLKFVIAF